MKTNHQKINSLALTAILAALTALLSFVNLPMFGLELTFTMVPVAVGAVLYGKTTGLILGSVFGLISFWQCLGYSPFGAALFAINPFYTFLTCVPTRMLAGFLAGTLADATRKKPRISCLVGSLCAPLFNTLFFMTVLILSFYRTDYIQAISQGFHTANPLVFAVMFVGLNGLIELLCGAFLAYPVSRAVSTAIAPRK